MAEQEVKIRKLPYYKGDESRWRYGRRGYGYMSQRDAYSQRGVRSDLKSNLFYGHQPMIPITQVFLDKITNFRATKKMTQKKFCKEAGINSSALYQIFNKQKTIRQDTYNKIIWMIKEKS